MDFAEIVVGEVQRNCMRVVFDFLRKSIRQSRESAHVHSHREVLSLNITRGDQRGIRIAANNVQFDADALRGAVTCFIIRARQAWGKQLWGILWGLRNVVERCGAMCSAPSPRQYCSATLHITRRYRVYHGP